MNFKELPGISFTLFRKGDDRELTLEDDGRVAADIRPGTSVTIRTSIPRGFDGSTWRAFTVDDSDINRTPTMMRATVFPATDVYHKNVPIQTTANGQLVAYRQKNNFRILRIRRGFLQVFTVAVVVQNGTIWLTVDKTYHVDIANGTVFYPTDRPWQKLFDVVEEITKQTTRREAIVQLDLPNPADLSDNVGAVVWWDSSLANAGMGCVMTREGQVSVHWSQVKRDDSSRTFLKPGEPVTYDRIVPRSDGSGFRHQLQGVRPLAVVEASSAI